MLSDEVVRGMGRAFPIVPEPSSLVAPSSDPTTWENVETKQLEQQHLDALLANDVGAVTVKGVAGVADRVGLRAALGGANWELYADRQPPVGKLGITQTEHAGDMALQREYFARVADNAAQMDAIFATAGVDLRARVMEIFANAWSRTVGVAVDPELGTYAAGVFRKIGVARLHRDFAPVDARGWSIACVAGQLAWNVYLSVGDEEAGGETVVYRRPWTEALERFRVAGCYSYSAAAVAGAPSVTIRPQAGDLVIFQSRNFHEVLSTSAERITYSSFAGVTPEYRELVLYS